MNLWYLWIYSGIIIIPLIFYVVVVWANTKPFKAIEIIRNKNNGEIDDI